MSITFGALREQMNHLNGYTGSPGNDNINKIWAELDPGFQGASYCAAGVCYLWKHAGQPFPAIDHPWGYSYCPDAVIWGKKHGLWSANGHYEPGDSLFFCWDGTGVAEHTGITVKDDGAAGIHDFECNTSPQNVSGSQSNGDGCYFRIRPHGSMVMGVLKSSRWLSDHPEHHKHKHLLHPKHHRPPKHNPYHFYARDLPIHYGQRDRAIGKQKLDHEYGHPVHWAQWALAVPVDGVFGPATLHATKLFQRVHGLPQTGIIGSRTATALMKRTHPA